MEVQAHLAIWVTTCRHYVRQVDWAIPPRPIGEFFGKFTGLPEQSKLVPRLKCNLYYYREGPASPNFCSAWTRIRGGDCCCEPLVPTLHVLHAVQALTTSCSCCWPSRAPSRATPGPWWRWLCARSVACASMTPLPHRSGTGTVNGSLHAWQQCEA